METQEQKDLSNALRIAQRAQDPEHRRVLILAAEKAIGAEQVRRRDGEIERLITRWERMPEYLTASQCVRELRAIMMGGMAPWQQPFGPSKK